MTTYEENYVALIKDIQKNGKVRDTRNAFTKSVFGRTLVVDSLEHGFFPLLQGRKIFYKGVLGELAAMLKGPKTLKDLKDEGCNYWGKWANDDGTIELDYGNAWRNFNGVNQLKDVVESLTKNPYGRRHLITGWNPSRLAELSLPCCHMLYQWYVTNDGHLEMIWYQRSVDVMVGLPSDVIVAAAWNVIMAAATGYKPGKLTFMLGDTHIYCGHEPGVKQYLAKADGVRFKGLTYSYQPNVEADESPMAYFDNFSKDAINLTTFYAPQQRINFEVYA